MLNTYRGQNRYSNINLPISPLYKDQSTGMFDIHWGRIKILPWDNQNHKQSYCILKLQIGVKKCLYLKNENYWINVLLIKLVKNRFNYQAYRMLLCYESQIISIQSDISHNWPIFRWFCHCKALAFLGIQFQLDIC